jgi:hypothetical protein
MMQAERVLLETDAQGNLISVPKLPPNRRLEAIFLVLEEPTAIPAKRTPPAILNGSVSVLESTQNRTARQIAGDSEGDREGDPLMPSPGWPAGYFEETYGALTEEPLDSPETVPHTSNPAP